MRDLEALNVMMFIACSSINRGLVYNLFHQYIKGGDGCVGFPTAKLCRWIMDNCESIHEVTPELLNRYCRHY